MHKEALIYSIENKSALLYCPKRRGVMRNVHSGFILL